MSQGNFRRACLTLLVGTLIGLSFAFTAFAQTDSKPASSRLSTRISLDADDAYLPTVLAILAEKSGYNIVTGPGVSKTEKLTIKIKDAPIEEAMNLVVRAVGLSYELVGNSFLVAKPENIKSDVGQTTYMVSLKYADPIRVKELITQTKATVSVDSSTGKLLVIASPKVMAEIRSVVDEIDQPAQQIVLATRVVEVKVTDEEKVGVDWSRLNPIAFKISEGEQQAIPMKRFDEFGVFTRQQPIFDFALDWLLQNGKADVLTNSQVATMNGKAAKLNVVDKIPYMYQQQQVSWDPQGTAQNQVPQYTSAIVEVGVKLEITPKINADGNITTRVYSEVSSVYGFFGRYNDLPWVISRNAETTIRARDGETIMIGGLLGIKRSNTKQKVPFLGDIPYFGGLFSHDAEKLEKTDMIIEVTPSILKDGLRFQPSNRITDAKKLIEGETEGKWVK